MSYPPLIDLKNGFWPVVHLLYGVSEWNFTDMLTIKGYILWLRTSYHCVWRGIMLYPSVSVRPSVRPSAPFPIDNLSIYSRNFFKFCIHIVNGDEWYGIVNGQNQAIFNGVTALFRIGKMVSGLLFLYCSWYLNETSQIYCTSKVTYYD